LKRFENHYEISLRYLLMIAVVLDATEEFNTLFSKQRYQSIDELLRAKESKKRVRGRNNV
ncbi:MAG: XRE family transcriptional regulator, partial [Lentimicrobiaceae bacterium]